MPDPYDVSNVIHVSTNIGRGCPICSDKFLGLEDFADSVNHCLSHGCVLLHVGQETSRDDEGHLWHSTVAVLGLKR